MAGGETLKLHGEEVGVVNSPGWSHRLNKSLAIVHLQPAGWHPETELEVISDDLNTTAVVEDIPFFDTTKSRTHS